MEGIGTKGWSKCTPKVCRTHSLYTIWVRKMCECSLFRYPFGMMCTVSMHGKKFVVHDLSKFRRVCNGMQSMEKQILML